MNEREITTPIHCTVNGREWHLFTAEYKNDDGTFCLQFHALNMEHAAAIVEEIKETLTLKGEMVGVIEPDTE